MLFQLWDKVLVAISNDQIRLTNLYLNCQLTIALHDIETHMFMGIFRLSDTMVCIWFLGDVLINCELFTFVQGSRANASNTCFPAFYLGHLLNIFSPISTRI